MKKSFNVLGLLATLLVIIPANRSYADNVIPVLNIPEVVMPAPNAHDFWVKAIDLQKNSGEVWNAYSYDPLTIPPTPPPPAPAPPMGKRPVADDDTSTPPKVYTLEMKAAIVEENTAALAALREGLKYEYRCPPIRSSSTLMPYLSGFRSLARLLALESKVRAEQERWGDAMNVNLDSIEFGANIPRGGVMINELVGLAVQSIGRTEAWAQVGHLSTGEAQVAARRLGNIIDAEVPFSQALTDEKWYGESIIIELMKAGKLTSMIGDSSQMSWQDRLLLNLKMAKYTNQQIIDNYDNYMNKYIEASRYPYNDPRSVVDMSTIPSDPINDVMRPIFAKARYKAVICRVQNELLMTTLALQGYKAKYAEYPAQLKALTPEFLNQLPLDNFADGGTFKYRRGDDGGYLLYSVGPDGKDDNGTATTRPGDTSVNRFKYSYIDSKGDIVAGINKN